MKRTLFFAVFLLSIVAVFAQNKSDFNETFRAQYHYSPAENRMGKPLTSWKEDSTYHIIYQYNPYNLLEGYINWGHVTSKDLMHWTETDLLLTQPEGISDSMEMVPWSGAIVKKNSELHAWVNRWNKGVFKTSSSDGKLWSAELKTTGLDSLKQAEIDVFWHEASQKWVMFAFERKSTTMFILNSLDGLKWTETSSFNYTFGFPQVFELPVDRKADDTRWILATEKGTYITGKFDGETFNIESSIKKFNHSQKIGSTLFFESENKHTLFAISNIEGEQQADIGSYGQFSLPVEVSLHEFETGIEMIQTPISKVESLGWKNTKWADEKVYPGVKNNVLKRLKGKAVHLNGTIDVVNCDQFVFRVRVDRLGNGTEIGFNIKKSEINFLGTRLDYKPEGTEIEIEIFVDRSSVEVFIDGGRYVMTYPFSPSPEALKYELATYGGEILIKHLESSLIQSTHK